MTWLIKCEHCGYEQKMDYEKNVELVDESGIDLLKKTIAPGTYRYVCQKCGRSLESSRWYNGHWEELSPSSNGQARHGYAISQMDAVWLSIDTLKQKELQAPSKQFFYEKL